MKLKFIHVIAIAGLLFTFSCKPNGPACTTVWAVEYVSPSLFVEIDSVNKTLSLQIANMSPGGVQGEAYQSYFTGDFNVVVPFSNFTAPPTTASSHRAYAEMIMYNSETPDTVLDTTMVRAGISYNNIYAMVGLQKSLKPRLVTTTSGSFRIQKIGGNLLSQVIAGGDTVTENIAIPMNPVRFAFRLGSFNDSVVYGTTAIKINGFSVSGTTDCTLLSDQFLCNSIYVP